MLYVHRLMHCLNPSCSKPIELPATKSEDRQPNRARLLKDDWKRFFLCLECKHLHEYSRTNIQTEIHDTESPWECGRYRCWSIRYKCDERNCGTLIETFAVSDVDVAAERTLDIFRSKHRPPRLCSCGYWALAPQHPKEFGVIHCPFPY